MRKSVLTAALVVLLATTGAVAAQISGNYLEARTASVYVGACFANSEVGLIGNEAVLGWQIVNGEWNDVSLAGLAVAGVVRASHTLGDPHHSALPASSIVIVDERATKEQEEALVGFVRSQVPELFGNVLHVERAEIEFEVGEAPSGSGHESHGRTAKLVVGDLARIVTRALRHEDASCANPEVYYPPLARVNGAVPAFATTHEFKGNGLGAVWSVPNRPSAFVATFAH